MGGAPAGEVGAGSDDDAVELAHSESWNIRGAESEGDERGRAGRLCYHHTSLQPHNGRCVVEHWELSTAVGGRLWENRKLEVVLGLNTLQAVQIPEKIK